MAEVSDAARLLALAGTGLLAVAVLWIRRRETPLASVAAGSALASAAMLTGAAFYAWLVLPAIASLPRHPIIGGALIGWIFGAVPLALALPLFLVFLALDPRSLSKVEDPGALFWTSLAAVVASAVAGILMLQLLSLLRSGGTWTLLLVPVLVALFPFVRQLFWAPALVTALRRRQSRLEPHYADALRAWVASIGETYQLEKIEVLFGPAQHRNAAAIGFWPLTRFIMLGDGLTRVMPEHEARAILAHEVAHVLRSDVRNQTLLWIALGSLWVYVWVSIQMAAGLRGPWWAAAGGAGWAAVAYVAGRYSRHCELATDRLAGELIDDRIAMGAALIRLAEMTNTPPHRRFPTHPSLNERLTNLGAPPTAAIPTE